MIDFNLITFIGLLAILASNCYMLYKMGELVSMGEREKKNISHMEEEIADMRGVLLREVAQITDLKKRVESLEVFMLSNIKNTRTEQRNVTKVNTPHPTTETKDIEEISLSFLSKYE